MSLAQVTELESSEGRTQIEVRNYQKPLQEKHTCAYPRFGNFANVCILYYLSSPKPEYYVICSFKSLSARSSSIQCF